MTAVGRPRPPVRPEPGPKPPRLREFVTPEGVDLRLRIGDAGERAAAFILDVVFIVLSLIAFQIVVSLVFAAFALATRFQLAEAVQAIWLLGAFLLTNAYFVVFELTPRAATPGKRILGLRVAARDGGRLTAEAVFARNAMREIEVFLPLRFILASALSAVDPIGGWLALLGLGWSAGFALFPLFNRDRLRVGDVVAGTWVVKAPRSGSASTCLTSWRPAAASSPSASNRPAPMGSRSCMCWRTSCAGAIPRPWPPSPAVSVPRSPGLSTPGEADDAFLTAYYGALRGRLETRLLFGHRRKDKFDAA